jgi:hypothetical protein
MYSGPSFFLNTLPVAFKSLAHWISEAVEHTKTETVRSYLTGLQSHYVDLGLTTTVFEDERIKRILRGSLRIHGAAPIRRRAEITKDILTRIVQTLGCHYDDVNLRAAFTTAFAAFLRAGELTWDSWNPTTSPLTLLSRGSITFVDQGVLLHLPTSKTDQFRIHYLPLETPSARFVRSEHYSSAIPNHRQTRFSLHPAAPLTRNGSRTNDILWSLLPLWCSQHCRCSRNP